MVATFSVDDRNLRRRLSRIQRDIATNGSATTKQVGKILAIRAALLAPKDTGELRRFIKVIPIKRKDSSECLVGYENGGMGTGNPHPDRGAFSLPKFMLDSDNGYYPYGNKRLPLKFTWNSGTRKFLQEASKITRAEFRNRIRKVVHNALSYKTK